jgi:glycosyltransferase involved in cell wall biosynthesis
MNEAILSIVVPVYNTEKYLEQCLDSILQQNINDLEIICVNDGSNDSSLNILQNYAEDNECIKIINKKNSGYGDTINQGLKLAQGKYIGIVESDDFVVEEALKELVEIALKSDADIVKGNYYNYFSADNRREFWDNLRDFPKLQIINPKEYKQLFFRGPSIWSGIYKKTFLEENGIACLETPGASYQDTSFAFKLWACAKKVVLTDKAIINYRQDNDSSSSNITRNIFAIRGEYLEIRRFIQKQGDVWLYPLMAKAQFISYAWNANRLSAQNQMKFWLAVSGEFKELMRNGYISELYFHELELATVHRIIHDTYGFCMNCMVTDHFVPSTPELLDKILNLVGNVKYVDNNTDLTLLDKDDLLILQEDCVERVQKSGLYGYCVF